MTDILFVLWGKLTSGPDGEIRGGILIFLGLVIGVWLLYSLFESVLDTIGAFARRPILVSGELNTHGRPYAGPKVTLALYGVESDLMPGFIYVIKSRTYYKIGLTNDVEGRIKKLDTASESQLVLVCKIATNAMKKAETHLHERFSAGRVKGEWFNLSRHQLDFLESIGRIDVVVQPLPEATP